MLNIFRRNGINLSLVALALAVGLSGCGGSGGGSSSNNNHNNDDPIPASSGTLDLGVLSTDQVATVALGYFPVNSEDNASVSLGSAKYAGQGFEEELQTRTVAEPKAISHRCGYIDLSVPEEAELMAQLNGKMAAKLEAPNARAVNTTYTDLGEGETTSVYCCSSYKNVTVQKMHTNKETSSVIVLAEVKNGSPVITKEQALKIDEIFGVSNPYDSEGKAIGDRVRSTFGAEWRSGGGLDGTTKVIMVVFDEDTIGSAYYGFFYSGDAYTKENNSSSNEGEILYLNAAKLNNEIDIYSTIAHEFQHMCNFNQKVIHDGLFDGEDNETLTINEGKSVLSEDLTGFNLNAVKDGVEVPGNYFIYYAINGFFANPGDFPYESFSNAHGDYGKGYLSMRYIADRFGISKINKISTSKDVGIDNISACLSMPFSKIMSGMCVACTGLQSLPADQRFTSLTLDEDYKVNQNDSVKNVHLGTIEGPSYTVSSFKKGKVTLKPYTVSVVDVIGDGSNFKLTYDLPEDCTAQVIVSKDDTYQKSYDI